MRVLLSEFDDLQWWITSSSNILALKVRVIDQLIGGFAEFLEDYHSVASANDTFIKDEVCELCV